MSWCGGVKASGRNEPTHGPCARTLQCGDPDRIRELVAESGADFVTIGAFERQDFPAEALAAVREAGTVVHDEGVGR